MTPGAPGAPDGERGGADAAARGAERGGAGAARDHLAVVRVPIDLAALVARVTEPRCGAVAAFLGTVRSPNAGEEVAWIDYEGYEPMMARQLRAVAAELRRRRPELGRLAIVHRLGRLEPGEASIALVAASPHRDAAQAAVREGLELCKERLPVWKREAAASGERWVEGSSAATEPL